MQYVWAKEGRTPPPLNRPSVSQKVLPLASLITLGVEAVSKFLLWNLSIAYLPEYCVRYMYTKCLVTECVFNLATGRHLVPHFTHKDRAVSLCLPVLSFTNFSFKRKHSSESGGSGKKRFTPGCNESEMSEALLDTI